MAEQNPQVEGLNDLEKQPYEEVTEASSYQGDWVPYNEQVEKWGEVLGDAGYGKPEVADKLATEVLTEMGALNVEYSGAKEEGSPVNSNASDKEGMPIAEATQTTAPEALTDAAEAATSVPEDAQRAEGVSEAQESSVEAVVTVEKVGRTSETTRYAVADEIAVSMQNAQKALEAYSAMTPPNEAKMKAAQEEIDAAQIMFDSVNEGKVTEKMAMRIAANVLGERARKVRAERSRLEGQILGVTERQARIAEIEAGISSNNPAVRETLIANATAELDAKQEEIKKQIADYLDFERWASDTTARAKELEALNTNAGLELKNGVLTDAEGKILRSADGAATAEQAVSQAKVEALDESAPEANVLSTEVQSTQVELKAAFEAQADVESLQTLEQVRAELGKTEGFINELNGELVVVQAELVVLQGELIALQAEALLKEGLSDEQMETRNALMEQVNEAKDRMLALTELKRMAETYKAELQQREKELIAESEPTGFESMNLPPVVLSELMKLSEAKQKAAAKKMAEMGVLERIMYIFGLITGTE